jgi:hypothetical protein
MDPTAEHSTAPTQPTPAVNNPAPSGSADGSPSETSTGAETPDAGGAGGGSRRRSLGFRAVAVVLAALAAFTIGKPLVDRATAPTDTPAPAATAGPGGDVAATPQLQRLMDPGNLPLQLTQANLVWRMTGTYAAAVPGEPVGRPVADEHAIVLTYVGPYGCQVAVAVAGTSRPVSVDPSGAACADPAVATTWAN